MNGYSNLIDRHNLREYEDQREQQRAEMKLVTRAKQVQVRATAPGDSPAGESAIDPDAGRIDVDAIDCFDGTPLIDIKPWLPTIDIPPGQTPSTSDLNK